MARVKFGAIITEASGSLGGHTIQHSKGGMQIRTKPKPTESFNNLQYQVRRKNPCLQYSWKALSAIQKTVWDRYAVDHDIRSKKGDHEILSGHSLWMKYQYYNWNEECNLPVDPATASLLYPTFADYVPPIFQPIVPPVFPPHVDPPAKPTIALSGYLSLCEGQSVSLISSYGDFYLWSTGATTHTITVNTPGSYTVKVGNVGGLWSVDSDPTVVTIGSPPAAPVITVTDYLPGPVDDPNYILLIGEGSFATLTSEEANSYIWSTGEITRSIQVSATGFYTVRVANAQGCLSPLSQRITVQSYVRPPQPVITPSGPLEFCSFDPLCNAWVEVAPTLGAETHILSLAVLNGKLYGGTYPNGKLYEWGRASVILESSEAESYLWSTGETTRTITVSTSGSYTVTIKTVAGYESLPSAATVVTVNEPAKPVITPSGPLDIPSGGSVDLESSVGTTYLWNTGETTRTITVTTSGSYTVQVYDVNGCISLASDPAVVTVHDRGFKTRFVVAGDAAGRTIVLPLVQNRAEGALAYDFTVNWGDNSSSHIESYNAAARSHTFAAAGTYDVEIWGTCEGWSFNGGGSCNKITHILDFGVANGFNGFKYLKQGFNGCVQLISICAGGFLASGTGCLTDGFEEIFKSCYYLPSVPADLFRYHPNVTTNAFKAAFNQCGSLASIPSNLFRYNTAASTYAFYATFHSCSTLAAIPTDTYRDNILVSTSGFALCHNGNYALTSLPADLFRYNTAVSSDGFYGTFGGCDLLATYGANLFKYNILCSGNCFVETFDNCPVLQVRADTFYAAGESGTRFHDQSPSFDHCFYRYMFSGTQGTAPDLWNCDFGTGSPYTFWCFYGDGNNIDSLANYYSIPSEWLYEPE